LETGFELHTDRLTPQTKRNAQRLPQALSTPTLPRDRPSKEGEQLEFRGRVFFSLPPDFNLGPLEADAPQKLTSRKPRQYACCGGARPEPPGSPGRRTGADSAHLLPLLWRRRALRGAELLHELRVAAVPPDREPELGHCNLHDQHGRARLFGVVHARFVDSPLPLSLLSPRFFFFPFPPFSLCV
jgi:hypothetical protein